MPSAPLHVERIGTGPRVITIHGSMGHGSQPFEVLRDLADTYRIEFVDRRGFGRSAPRPDRVDFDLDADDIASILGDGAHLVGHSYGGVVALLAASRHPGRVRSISVIEPPLFAAAPNAPAVVALRTRLATSFPAPSGMRPGRWLAGFVRALGSAVPDELPVASHEEADVRASMHERPPWEATPDLTVIRDASIPTLVIRGDWVPDPGAGAYAGEAFREIAEAIVDATGGSLLVVPGATHAPQSERSDMVLAALRTHVATAEAAAAQRPMA